MSAEEVAKFYNGLHNQDVDDRQSSRIIYLRGFNNWIKSMLIQDAKAQINQAFPGYKFTTVLDLACGKGGDMWKWQKADIEEIIFADVASKSIEQCRQRYMEGRTRTGNHAAFGASFIVIDATGEKLAEKLPRPMSFEIVSCQFALHYAFRSEKNLRMMLYNVSLNLKSKGVFVGTMTDGERIVQYLRKTNNGIFENDVVKVEYVDKVGNWSNLTPPLFGAKIKFALDTQVNCPEYLAYFPLLVEIAKEFNLELVFCRSFPEAIDHYYNKMDNRTLMGRMRALEEYPIDDDRYNSTKENFAGFRKLKEEYDHAEKRRKDIINSGERRTIQDQYMFHVLDKSWHARCLSCADCKTPQTESCFYRDGLILCKADFTRRFGTRCAGCNDVLERQDLVRRARDLVFHVRCFRCGMCQKTLDTGEQLYVVGGNRFICKDDYLSSSVGSEECGSLDEVDENVHEEEDDGSNEAVSPGSHNFQENSQNQNLEHEASTAGSGDDKTVDDNGLATKRRGPRTTIKSKQLETLKAAFAATPKPTRHMREQLAAETGLNMRVIQASTDYVWFQNRRSKERRMKQSRIACGFRPPRRNRQNQPIRPEEVNGVYCDVLDPMQPQDPSSFYPGGMPPGGPFFPTQEAPIYSTLPHDIDNSTFPRPDHQQLEALAAAVHVSSGDYHLEEALIQSAGLNGGSALPVW